MAPEEGEKNSAWIELYPVSPAKTLPNGRVPKELSKKVNLVEELTSKEYVVAKSGKGKPVAQPTTHKQWVVRWSATPDDAQAAKFRAWAQLPKPQSAWTSSTVCVPQPTFIERLKTIHKFILVCLGAFGLGSVSAIWQARGTLFLPADASIQTSSVPGEAASAFYVLANTPSVIKEVAVHNNRPKAGASAECRILSAKAQWKDAPSLSPGVKSGTPVVPVVLNEDYSKPISNEESIPLGLAVNLPSSLGGASPWKPWTIRVESTVRGGYGSFSKDLSVDVSVYAIPNRCQLSFTGIKHQESGYIDATYEVWLGKMVTADEKCAIFRGDRDGEITGVKLEIAPPESLNPDADWLAVHQGPDQLGIYPRKPPRIPGRSKITVVIRAESKLTEVQYEKVARGLTCSP